MCLQNRAIGFTYIMAAERVAFSYNLKFAECDCAKIKASIGKRIQAKNQYKDNVINLIDGVVTPSKSILRDARTNQPNANNRAERRSVQQQDGDPLTSSKL